ncbi:MAG: hypothetical protein KDC13_05465 [Bacteroidetes bacterium]|nr:hypothetical protein [Bacteroidota bacterium]
MKHLLLLCSLVLTFQMNAQSSKGLDFVDGWAKTNRGDTLRGQICFLNTKTGERLEKIYFVDATGSKKRLGSDRLDAFGTANETFEFIDIGDGYGKVMMQKVVDGDLNLLFAWFKTEKSTPRAFDYEKAIFLQKKGKPDLVEVFDRKFEKDMAKYFKGDEDIIELMKKNNWGIADLDKIVKAYNAKE